MKDEDYRHVLFLRNSKIYRMRRSNLRKIKKELKKHYQMFVDYGTGWSEDDLREIKKLHFIHEDDIKKLISNGETLIEIGLYINEEDYKNDDKEDLW
ncbi:hypothetical protein [Comamonas terrigena]|uniref:hypothetical protein n=1 Tax=Comamonas terrigena TaxID=32013 RepID=UPI0028AD967E|nr:hypothetical protein [Comamonas terrigena]